MFKALTPFLSIVTAIVVGFFFIKPMYEEIKGLQMETEQYREAVQKADESNKRLKELLEQKNSFKASALERLDIIAPDSVNQIKLLVDLEALARKHNMLFGNVGVGEGETSGDSDDAAEEEVGGSGLTFEEDFRSVDISFGLIGTYDQFRKILVDIERSLSIMEIMKVEFKVLEGDLQQYDITIRAYALRQATI